MAAPVAATARGRRTREQLLSAAADLVAERGFHAVGIADIGAAAGVSGAAIYRHFASKQDILVALLDRVVEGLRDGAPTRRSRTPARRTTSLDAFDRRARRLRTARPVDHRRVRPGGAHAARRRPPTHPPHAAARTPRPGSRCCGRARRRSSPTIARAAVHAAFGLVNSVSDYRTELADADLRALLVTMTAAALEEPARAPQW